MRSTPARSPSEPSANALGLCTGRVSQHCGAVSCRDNARAEPEPEPAELDDEDEIQRAIAMSLAEEDEQPVQAGAEEVPAEHVAATEGAEQTDATEPTVRTSFFAKCDTLHLPLTRLGLRRRRWVARARRRSGCETLLKESHIRRPRVSQGGAA
eukprot:COSAG04_NODE_516_length_13191_cov_3.382371_8_plen_154_part_00